MSSHADSAALIVAVFPAGVSALSLIVSVRTYRREGARVRIRLESRGDYWINKQEAEIVVKIYNKGMGPIQVTGWFIEFRKVLYLGYGRPCVQLPGTWRSLWPQQASYDPPIPFTVDGYHEVNWTIPYENFGSHYNERGIKEFGVHRNPAPDSHSLIGRYMVRKRLVVTLGTGNTIRRCGLKYFYYYDGPYRTGQ
jgi:hypothetical protein